MGDEGADGVVCDSGSELIERSTRLNGTAELASETQRIRATRTLPRKLRFGGADVVAFLSSLMSISDLDRGRTPG